MSKATEWIIGWIIGLVIVAVIGLGAWFLILVPTGSWIGKASDEYTNGKHYAAKYCDLNGRCEYRTGMTMCDPTTYLSNGWADSTIARRSGDCVQVSGQELPPVDATPNSQGESKSHE